jgi:hypothetical protein
MAASGHKPARRRNGRDFCFATGQRDIGPTNRIGANCRHYTDQESVLKFIERNWHLNKISKRSRDNLPNPIMIE